MACDDFVLSSTSDRRRLCAMPGIGGGKKLSPTRLGLGAGVAGTFNMTTQRVARILSPDRPAATNI